MASWPPTDGKIRNAASRGLVVTVLAMVLLGAAGAVPRLCDGLHGAAFAKGGDDSGGDNGGDDGGGGDGKGDGDTSGKDGADDGGGKGRGRGRDGDDDDGRSMGSRTGNGGADFSARASGARAVSITPDGIVVTFNDGARADIRNGRYSFQDPGGDVVESRRATGADIALMKSITNGLQAARPGAPGQRGVRVVRTETTPNRVRVSYSNGWMEEIRRGTYRLVDGFGNAVISRPASEADTKRLARLAGR